MEKMGALHKNTLGLTWEEKWAIAEAALRESRSEQMAGIDEAILHMRRFVVYEGDSPPPTLSANCSTEQERLGAVLRHLLGWLMTLSRGELHQAEV
jgi:hypothetical protein